MRRAPILCTVALILAGGVGAWRWTHDARPAEAGAPLAARVWRDVGELRTQRGEIDRARDAYRRAFEIERRAKRPAQAARDAYVLYSSYWETAEYRQALHYAAEALQQAEAAGDQATAGRVLLGLFMILYDIGDVGGAENALRRAAKIVPRDDPAWSYVQFNRGLVRRRRGDLAAATSAYQRFLQSAPADHPLRPSAHFNLVEIALESGDPKTARAHLEAAEAHGGADETRRAAIAYYRGMVLHAGGHHAAAKAALAAVPGAIGPDWEHRIEALEGDVLAALGEAERAEEAYERAIAAVERLRATFPDNDLKSWLLEAKRAPYEALLSARLERGAVRDALAVSERIKARVFLDAYLALGSSTRPAAAEDAAARAELLSELVADLGTSAVAVPPDLATSLAAVGERAVWTYVWADDELWLITSAGETLRASKRPATRGEVGRHIQALLADPDAEDAARALGAMLIPELLLPPAGQTLYVVTDGRLGEIPFAALIVAGERLVVRHPIAYVPSIGALAALLQEGERGGGAVVLGDARGDLPSARRECQAVAGELRAAAHLGSSATVARFRASARASVLHLAVHAGIGARGAWLELADGAVDIGDILRWRVAPELVVLASCVSAARRGSGMWGSLGAAFLAAGSRTVVASLWSVDDEATEELVRRFYDEGGRRDPVGALARTQRALARDGHSASTWAPFVVFGAAPATAMETETETPETSAPRSAMRSKQQ